MKLVEEMIRSCYQVQNSSVLKVDCFLSHRIDPILMEEFSKEFNRLFRNERPNKVLTMEGSGIAIAILTARSFGIPLVFAKRTDILEKNPLEKEQPVFQASVKSSTENKTHQIQVEKRFLLPTERVLIIDDFLAKGRATNALVDIVHQSGATLCGVGVIVEKAFQKGGEDLRNKGVNVHSLAIVESINPQKGIVFASNPDHP